MITSTDTVRLQRTIAASPARVYRAWLDPQLVRRWMAPGDLEVTRVEIDERVGGRYRIWQGGDAGDAGGFEAELLEMDVDRRIVWRWGFVGPQREAGPVYDSRLTVELAETEHGATELTLVHEHLEELRAAMPEVADNVEAGWATVLDALGPRR